jgi:hypothetical protein
MITAVQTSLPLSEASLQRFADDLLAVRQVPHIRVPDSFWRWTYTNIPARIRQWFFGLFGGLPDCTIFFPLDARYSLALMLELKRPGAYLRPSQRVAARRVPWYVCRSPEEIMQALDRAQQTADAVKTMLADTTNLHKGALV